MSADNGKTKEYFKNENTYFYLQRLYENNSQQIIYTQTTVTNLHL